MPSWRTAVAARGWWPGASRSPASGGPPSPSRPTGAGPCRASAIPGASILLLGLAPAAHGANRTGRMFTGDRSGDFLFAALWRCGFANQPQSVSRDDGLRLNGVWITAAVRCAPPANRPTPQERDTCLPWSAARTRVCWRAARVVDLPRGVRLGRGAATERADQRAARPGAAPAAAVRPRRRADGSPCALIGCYHPSQQNTFTGKLTATMLDDVLRRARELANADAG